MDTASSRRLRDFIEAHLPVTPVPTVPEIRLHRAGPTSGMGRLVETAGADAGSPYWAYHWGGGLALARHVLDHPEAVAGRRVLDLGTGSGIVAIAAARSAARHVIAADTSRDAIAALHLNAAHNGVTIHPHLGDLTSGPPPEVDVVLVGDLFYEAALARRVTGFLDRCLHARIDVLIGDPGRAFLPRPRLRLITDYPGPDFGDGEETAGKRNAVFAFQPAQKTS